MVHESIYGEGRLDEHVRAGHQAGKASPSTMATVDLTADTFEATVEEGGILFIDFWADWCGPCKAFAPVYERVSEAFPDVVFGKVDTEAEQELAGAFGIRSIPTTVVFKEGIGVFMQPGALPEDALKDLVAKVKELDMDEVRAEIEAQEAAMAAEAAALED
jgi:thioredoxin 1